MSDENAKASGAEWPGLRDSDLNWVLRGLPKPIMDLLKRHPGEAMLAGGFIRSRLANEFVQDIDLFGPSTELIHRFVGELNPKQATREVKTKNAITICHRPSWQFIHRWCFDDPRSLCESFDFTIARAVVWFDGAAERFRSMVDPEYYADLAMRRLNYRNPDRSEDAGGSLLRALKFYQRGYRIDLRSLADVVWRLASEVDAKKLSESRFAGHPERIILALLHEVDPAVDLTHAAHLPSDLGAPDAEEEVADG